MDCQYYTTEIKERKPLTYVGNTVQVVKNALTGEYEPTNTDSLWFEPTRISTSADAGSFSTIDNDALRFAAQTGTSIFDNLLLASLFGDKALYYMGASAAGDTTYAALENGATPEQAAAEGTLAGLYELATEKLPLDNFFKLVKGGGKPTAEAIKDILKQSGIEASEELITEYMNVLTNISIEGENSEYNQYIRYLMEVEQMSQEEATAEAKLEFFVLRPMQSAASGFVSGTFFGGLGTATSNIDAARYGKGVDVQAVIDTAQATGDTSLSNKAAELAAKLNENGKASNAEVGNLVKSIVQHNQTNTTAQIKQAANEMNLSPETRQAFTNALAIESRMANGTATQTDSAAYSILTGAEVSNGDINRLVNASSVQKKTFERATGKKVIGVSTTTLRANIAAATSANSRANTAQNFEAFKQTLSGIRQSSAQAQYAKRAAALDVARQRAARWSSAQTAGATDVGNDAQNAVNNYAVNADRYAPLFTEGNTTDDGVGSVLNAADRLSGKRQGAVLDSVTRGEKAKESSVAEDFRERSRSKSKQKKVTKENTAKLQLGDIRFFAEDSGSLDNTASAEYNRDNYNNGDDTYVRRKERTETTNEFLERTRKEGLRSIKMLPDETVAAFRDPRGRLSQKGKEARSELDKYGIEPIVFDGDTGIRIHKGNKTVEINDGSLSITKKSGTTIAIGITEDAILKEHIGHELFHLWAQEAEAQEFESIVWDNVLLGDAFNELFEHIEAAYFDNSYDPANVADKKLFDEEFVAYISGMIHSGQDISGFFENPNAIIDAWNKVLENHISKSDTAYGKDVVQNAAQTEDADGDSISREQAEYFKDSKVRDEHGKLIKVYHGTPNAGFTTFDLSRSEWGRYGFGFYFTSEKREAAGRYSEFSHKTGKNKGVYEAYLNITNPVEWDRSFTNDEWEQFADRLSLSDAGKQELIKWLQEDGEHTINDFVDWFDWEWQSDQAKLDFSAHDWVNALQSFGYDGAFTIDPTLYGRRVMPDSNFYTATWNFHAIAFDPSQIKRVDNRTPTDSRDIRFSRRTSTGHSKGSDYHDALTAQEWKRFYNALSGTESVGQMVGSNGVLLYNGDNINNSKLICYKRTSGEVRVVDVFELINYDETIHDEVRGVADKIAEAVKREYSERVISNICEDFGQVNGTVFRRYDSESADYVEITGEGSDSSVLQQDKRSSNRGRDTGSNRANGDGTGGIRFSRRSRRYNSSRSIDDYSEETYNRSGWAYLNGVLSPAESAAFNAKIAELRAGSRDYHRSADGLYILEIGTHNAGRNVLVYTDGNWDSPSIEKIVKFYFDSEYLIEEEREFIYEHERRGVSNAAEISQDTFGEEFLRVYSADDAPSFQELAGERKGSSGAEDNQNNRTVSDGEGSGPEDSGSLSGTGEVKFSLQRTDYDSPITTSDIESLRSIGRKSINDFSAEDTKKSQKWAHKFWKQLGTKSPFFRSWFGDWRAHDTTKVAVATERGSKRGDIRNQDTGWKIRLSGKVFNESRHNGLMNKAAMPYLDLIGSVIENAVLLDSKVIDKPKSPNSLFMHSMYVIADLGENPQVLKLYVEEMNDPNSADTAKRAYQLQNIEISSSKVQGSQEVSPINRTADAHTVADLFALVKRYDLQFVPHDVNPALLNEDGTRKGGFTAFKDWSYWTENKDYAHRYTDQNSGETMYSAYLTADEIFDTRDPKCRSIFEEEYQGNYSNTPLQESGLPDWTDGYDLAEFFEENGYDYDMILLDEGADPTADGRVAERGISYVVKKSGQIKSASDNIGTFDRNSDDIRFSRTTTRPAIARTDTVTSDEVIANLNAGKYTGAQMRHFAEQLGVKLTGSNMTEKRANLAEAIREAAWRSLRSKLSLELQLTEADIEKELAEQRKRAKAEEKKRIAEQRKQAEEEKAKAKDSKRFDAEIHEAARKSITRKFNVGSFTAEVVDIYEFYANLPENRRGEMNQLIRDQHRFAKAFGHKVNYIANTDINGLYHNGEMYVSIEHIREMKLKAIAHEITHDMAAKDPSLVTGFYNLYREYCEKHGRMDEFNARMNDAYTHYNDGVYNYVQFALVEELMCDTFAELVDGDSAFYDYCLNYKPTLAQRIVEFFNRIINKLFRRNEPEAAFYAAEIRGYLLRAAASYKNSKNIKNKLSGTVRADAADADRIIRKTEGKYIDRNDAPANAKEWSEDISGNAALRNLRSTAPREYTDYGFRDVTVGGKKQTVLVVDPQLYLTDKEHLDTLETTRSMAASLGIPVGFTTGQSASMHKVDGKQRELATDYDSLLTDDGTLLINLGSNVPYTYLLTNAWCQWLRYADPQTAAEIDRLARRVSYLMDKNITAEFAAARTISGKQAKRTAGAITLNSDKVLEWIMSGKEGARAFAHQNPTLIRRLLEQTGDVIIKAFGKGNPRAASLTAHLHYRMLHALSETADAAEYMMYNSPSSQIAKRKTKKKKPLPDRTRLMALKGYNSFGDEVYETSDYVKGLTQQERLDRFWKLFEESYFDKTVRFEKNGKLYEAQIDRFTRKENISKNVERSPSNKAKAKLGADGDFITLMENALFDKEKDNRNTSKNDAHKNVVSFDYYEKTIVVDGRAFDVIINVRNKADGNHYVYEVRFAPNKKRSDIGSSLNEIVQAPPPRENATSDHKNNIPRSDGSVKLSRTAPTTLRTPTSHERRAWLDEYGEQYGTIPEGENVNSRGDQRVPAQIDEDSKIRRTYRTVMEAKSTPDEYVGELEREVVEGRASYTPVSNKAAMSYAEQKMSEGIDEAMATWHAVTHGDTVADKKQIALGERLIMEAIKNRDVKAFTRLVSEVAAEATRAGQMVQAISMIKRLSPEGQLMSFQKEVAKINEEIAPRKGHVEPDPKLTEEYMDIAEQLEEARKRLADMEHSERSGSDRNSDEYYKDKIESFEKRIADLESQLKQKRNDMIRNVADQMPHNWMDGLRAWRYLAMLGNPRTHIRNVLGNAVFIPAVRLKQAIAGGMERAFIRQGDRTQGITASRELKEFAKTDALEALDDLASGGKYNHTDEIRAQQKSFREKTVIGKTLNKIADINSAALEGEDTIFLRNHYAYALSRYAAANRWTVDFLKKHPEELQRARGFAFREAQRATYRDLNSFSSLMTRMSNKMRQAKGFGKLGYVMFEGAMPFKKTPCNIMKRGVEYSPLGIASAISKGAIALYESKKGMETDYTATEFINDMAAGLTGTMIVALGYLLTSLGMLHGRDKDEEDEINALRGVQEYSINIGGYSYTIDWVTPVAFPLFVGAELYDQIHSGDDTFTMDDFYDALSSIAEPLFSLSMMDGVQSMMQSYSSEGAVFQAGQSAAESYLNQYMPTLGGQLARTIAPEVHTAYYRDKTDAVDDFTSTIVQKGMAKVPGLYEELPEKIDPWGRNVGAGKPWYQRAAENFFSPGYLNKVDPTDADKLVQELYEKTGDTGVIPSNPSKYFQYNGERYDMGAEEYVQYSKTRGQTAYEIISEFANSEAFAHLTPEQQLKCVDDAYKLATTIAKCGTDSGYTLEDAQYKWHRDAYKAQDSGDSTYAEYIIKKNK